MAQAVLISIRPEWAKLIARGAKTVEIRKTRPRMSTPFKCYIYKTLGCPELRTVDIPAEQGGGCFEERYRPGGKVVGEFVCYNICPIAPAWGAVENFEETIYGSCLSLPEAMEYYHSKRNRTGDPYIYVWHISQLKIYDRPKELSKFSRFGFLGMGYSTSVCGNFECKNYIEQPCYDEPPECKIDSCQLRRPPQSWCYVAGLDGDD